MIELELDLNLAVTELIRGLVRAGLPIQICVRFHETNFCGSKELNKAHRPAARGLLELLEAPQISLKLVWGSLPVRRDQNYILELEINSIRLKLTRDY